MSCGLAASSCHVRLHQGGEAELRVYDPLLDGSGFLTHRSRVEQTKSHDAGVALRRATVLTVVGRTSRSRLLCDGLHGTPERDVTTGIFPEVSVSAVLTVC